MTTGAPAARGRRWPGPSGSSPSAPSTTPPTSARRSATRPDALLVDVNAWGAAAAAEGWAGPWAMFCPYPLPLRSADVPPFGPGLPPAHGPLGRLRDQLLRPIMFGMLERTMVPPLNRVRGRLGLAPVADADDLFGRVPLLLYLSAEPFEYPRRDWPGNVVLVGPCDWDPPADPPGWLERLDRPVVLVTTSSEFQDDHRLVKVTLQALAEEPVAVVATVPAGDPAGFQAPANARVERFIPHAPVLDRAVCAVTHGGMGATQKALAHGVPVCAVPFGRDQLEVARRVEVAGAAPGWPHGACAPTACAPRCTRRSGCARAPGASSRASPPRAGRPPPPTRSRPACCTGSSHRTCRPER
jgi:UDP:flavonoid glycosyltransferase YjiC (YdhE family)